MYSTVIVNRLLREQRKNGSDLAEYIYGDRRHTVRHLMREGANPTSEILEKIAEFLNVSIDELFGRVDPHAGDTRNIELMEKLISSQENQIKLHEDENKLLKDKIRLLEFENSVLRGDKK